MSLCISFVLVSSFKCLGLWKIVPEEHWSCGDRLAAYSAWPMELPVAYACIQRYCNCNVRKERWTSPRIGAFMALYKPSSEHVDFLCRALCFRWAHALQCDLGVWGSQLAGLMAKLCQLRCNLIHVAIWPGQLRTKSESFSFPVLVGFVLSASGYFDCGFMENSSWLERGISRRPRVGGHRRNMNSRVPLCWPRLCTLQPTYAS